MDKPGLLLTTTNAKLTRVFEHSDVDLAGCEMIYDYGGWDHEVEFLGDADPDLDSDVLSEGVALGQTCFCTEGEGRGIIENSGGDCGWDHKKWHLAERGRLDPWHFDIVWANRRLDHMWLDLNLMQLPRLEMEVYGLRGGNQQWHQTHIAAERASRERLEAIVADPDTLALYRQHIRWP